MRGMPQRSLLGRVRHPWKVGGAEAKREGQVIRKLPFLIGNKHFLIRKGHFTNHIIPYVPRSQSPLFLPIRSFPMIRRKLIVAVAVIFSVVLTA